MSLLNLTKGLFATKEAAVPPPKVMEEPKKNYQDYGYHQAYQLGGTMPGLNVCLYQLYFDFKERMRKDQVKQEELKKPIRVTLEEHKGDIERWENKIGKISNEHIPVIKQKIEILKEEKSHIRKNPHEIIGDVSGKVSFYIGVAIFSFLSIYLWTFYSSASYSAFFKTFELTDIGLANSIFDAQAVSKSLEDGVMETVLIFTVPFVFLGLGYLIHKMWKWKGFFNYLRIGGIVLITLAFDVVLAYNITEKIYKIEAADRLEDVPFYSFSLAFKDMNFWLIIFAGFVVYIIWGIVLEFVLEAFGKLDKVKVALKEIDKKIADANKAIEELKEDIDRMNHQIDDAKTQIKKLHEVLNGVVISREFELEVFAFMPGWMSWMKGNGRTHEELETAGSIVQDFVRNAIYNYTPINN